MPAKVPAQPEYNLMVGSWFFLDIPGITIEGITEVSGLSMEVDLVDYTQAAEGGKTITKKRPAVVKYGSVTLKRPFTGDKKLYEWEKLVRDGKQKDLRKSGSLVLFDFDNTEVGRWNFVNAWPSKWSISDLDVASDDPIVEEVALAIEEITREK